MNAIDAAYDCYLKYIYDLSKINLLRVYNLKVSGSVSPVMWELFCAIITGTKGSGYNYGADLVGWEVKSAKTGGSYEYQYHLNTGLEKLHEDCLVKHVFCEYSENYDNVSVRFIPGFELREKFFEKWIPECELNYRGGDAGERKQRFRKNIPYKYVRDNSKLILEIKEGVIIRRDDALIQSLNGY